MTLPPWADPTRLLQCVICEEYWPAAAMCWIAEDGLTLVASVGRWGHTSAYETRPDDPLGVAYCRRCARYLDVPRD